MVKLKPCPFCGHSVRVRSYQEEKTDWKIETHIECESEGCFGANVRFASEWGEDPDLFIRKWNNRKAPPPCPACEAAARELADLRARLEALASELPDRHWPRTSDAGSVAEQIAAELRALLRKEAK